MVAARSLQQNNKSTVVVFDFAMIAFFKGDRNAALLFNQILYWSDRTDDADGWFYKTYADWMNELDLSRYQVNRILRGDKRTSRQKVTLNELGVETMVRRGRYTGNPTVHYRINRDVLLQAMQAYFERTGCLPAEKSTRHSVLQQCYTSIRNIVAGRTPSESQIDLQQSRTSKESEITTEKESSEIKSTNPHPPPDDDSEIEIFTAYVQRFGKLKKQFPALLRAELERLGAERVGQVLERCATHGRSWNYVLRALANETASPSENPVQDCSVNIAMNVQTRFEVVAEPELPVTERVKTGWDSFGGEARTVAEAWSAALHQMQMQFGAGSFLVNKATLVDFEPENATFTVVVQNANVRDQLQQRYYRLVRRIMSDIFGSAAEVYFVAKADWSLPENVAQDGG